MGTIFTLSTSELIVCFFGFSSTVSHLGGESPHSIVGALVGADAGALVGGVQPPH